MAVVTYTAKRQIETTGFLKAGTDFQAIASDDSINAVTTSLSGLLTDQWLQAAGFAKNSAPAPLGGWFQVKSNSTSAKILTLTPPIDHLRLPGVNGNNAQTPDSVANSVTGSIELMAKIAPTAWIQGPSPTLIAKDDGVANRDYDFQLGAGKALSFVYSTDGSTTAGRIAVSTLPVPFEDGVTAWVKVTYNSGTGIVQFFTSPDGVVFTQLGTNVTITSGAIHNGSGALIVGQSTFPNQAFSGQIYYAEVRNGIGGPIVAAFDPTRGARGASSFVAATGETWTINSSGTPPAMLQGPRIVDEGAEYMSCASNANAQTPDSVAISVTGSIELTAKVALTDWTSAAIQTLIGKYQTSNLDYHLYIDTAGKPNFTYSTDGSTITGRTATSSAAVPFADGTTGWIKATYNSGTGAVQFFTRVNDTDAFVQLGTTQTITSGALHDGNQPLFVGNAPNGAAAAGLMFYAEVRNGIGGTVVAAFDVARAAAGAGSFVAYTGETWTVAAPFVLVRTTPVTVTGYKRGYGQSYSIEFKAEQADRKVKVKRSEQQPLDASKAPETLLYGQRATVDVLTEILDEATQLPQFREFLASVSAGEIFTFDRYGTIAAPVDPRLAQLEVADYEEKRSMTSLRQRVPFTVRLLS
jgi:hypothetical protein